MRHVFISYVHEDISKVAVLKSSLEEFGVKTWFDKANLAPGDRWKPAIKKAIEEGTIFIACFSDNYNKKLKSYMNEELTIAIEQLRQRPFNKSWFIPVRLTDCDIPDKPIGAGEYLSDIHRIDMFNDFNEGIEKLAQVIVPIISPREYLYHNFKRILKYHINKKIEHYNKLGATLFREVIIKWIELLDEKRFEIIFSSFFELHERARLSGKHEFERIIESDEDGRIILLSVTLNQNIAQFINLLPCKKLENNNRYMDFIIEQKRETRILPNWEKKDFVHILYFDEDGEMLFDMLYLENFKLMTRIINNLMKKKKNFFRIGKKKAFMHASMYPSCLLNSMEASSLHQKIIQEEAKFYQS